MRKGIRIVTLAVLSLLPGRRVLADSVDDYVRQQMKEKHIPGGGLSSAKMGKRSAKKRTVSQMSN